MDDGATREFGTDECLALLGDSGVARVALSRHALPVIDPVHYRRAGELLVIAGERGRSIAVSADEHHVVCFEAEGLSGGDGALWVVQITGLLGTVGDHQMLHLTTAMISGRVWLTPDRTAW